MLFVAKDNIRGIPPSPNVKEGDAMVPVVGTNVDFVAADYHAEQEAIYFSDVRSKNIYRKKIDGNTGNLNRTTCSCLYALTSTV